MPTTSCAITGCTHNTYHLRKWKSTICEKHNTNKGQGLCDCPPPFHLRCFPVDPDLRNLWVKAVNRIDIKTAKNWQPGEYDRICSKHFDCEMSYPTLDLGHSNFKPAKPRRKLIKYDSNIGRKLTNNTTKVTKDTQENLEKENICETVQLPHQHDQAEVSAEDHAYSCHHGQENAENEHCYSMNFDCEKCHEKQKLITSLLQKIEKLEQKIDNLAEEKQPSNMSKLPKAVISEKKTMCEKALKSDKKVKFYTGLPSTAVFELVFEMVKAKVENMNYWSGSKNSKKVSTKVKRIFLSTPEKFGRKRKLCLKDEFLLTLMKLRLSLLNEDLADRFEVSKSVTSKIFNTWVKALSHTLSGLICYPPKENIQSNLPACFKDYPRLRCILDCTEFFIDRPRELELQAQTWSDYKKHNTAKCLVGITPCGSISFLSDAWGGRASDVHIVRESGFLRLVDRGDQIMGDKGFTMKEDLLELGAELTIPPGARGNEQMSPDDVSKTKKVANLRIHVERAINRIKHFRILKHTMPISLLPLLDDIVKVCGSLCNLLPPLVNKT